MFRLSGIKRVCTILALAVGTATPGHAQQPVHEPTSNEATSNDTPWVVSVVHSVDLQKLLARLGEQQNARVGVSGSAPEKIFNVATGLVVDQQGHVVTRLLNIDPSDKHLSISITTNSGKTLSARLVGTDIPTGFAVLEVPGLDIEPPVFTSVNGVAPQMAVKIVNSEFEPTANATTGKISFVPTIKRIRGEVRPGSVYVRARGAFALRAAGLLSCNDGSVVISASDNKVVGMAQYAGYGRAYFFPIAFIRDTVAKRVIERRDNVPAGWLGVKGTSLTQLTDTEASDFGLNQKSGFFVREVVPNSPATESGLRPNDIIIGAEDLSIVGETDLSALVASSPAGRHVRLRAIRNHEPIEVKVVLGARVYSASEYRSLLPASPLLYDQMEGTATAQIEQIRKRLEELDGQYKNYVREPASREREEAIREIKIEIQELREKERALSASLARLTGRADQVGGSNREIGPSAIASFAVGFEARDLTKQLAVHLGTSNGVWVTNVIKGSPAEQAGLKAGDVITSVQGRSVTATRQLETLLAFRTGSKSLRIVRDRQPISISLSGQ
jgi:S1-C subfamily serine protease